jgi:hypothetical protein
MPMSVADPDTGPATADPQNNEGFRVFTRTDLTTLIDAAPGVGVSIFLPMQKVGRETRQNPIALKNMLSEAEESLSQQGVEAAQITTLLAPAQALLDDYDFWQNQDHGLALFLSDAGMQTHKLPVPMAERVVTGPEFHIAPLLPLLDGDAPFVVLSATAEGVHTHLATRFEMLEMFVTDMPISIETMDEPDYEGNVQSHGFGRPNTGRLSMPKTQVYGDSPEEWRKGRLVEYTRRAAIALSEYLAGAPVDVVIVSDAEIAGHLAKSEALAPRIAGSVEVNPAALSSDELHEAAWDVMQPVRDGSRDAALERLETRLGQGDPTASTDPEPLIIAAHEGRVEELLLAKDTALHGSFDPESGTAKVAEDQTAETVDLADTAARLTLRNGGTVRVVPADRLPTGAAMAAILRY